MKKLERELPPVHPVLESGAALDSFVTPAKGERMPRGWLNSREGQLWGAARAEMFATASARYFKRKDAKR